MPRTAKPQTKGRPPRLPDKRVADLLDLLDERRGATSIEKVCELAGVAESSWYSWRKGTTAPDFADLADVAEAVGIRVGPVLDPRDHRPGGLMASREARMVAQLMARLDGGQRQQVVDWVLNFVETHTSASRPPREPGSDGKADPGSE